MSSTYEHVEFHKPWFSGSPVNSKHASGVLTFVGTVGDSEYVQIGSEIFEFDSDNSVSGSNIAVDISGGATSSDAVTAIVAALEDSELVSGSDGAGDTVDIESLLVGEDYNYVVTTNCISATFDHAHLQGGQLATPAKTATLIKVSDIWYMTNGPVSRFDESGWFSAAITTL